VLAYKHRASAKAVDAGQYPTNEAIIQALQLKVYKTVEVTQRYRRVFWYSLFVAAYLIILYLQVRWGGKARKRCIAQCAATLLPASLSCRHKCSAAPAVCRRARTSQARSSTR